MNLTRRYFIIIARIYYSGNSENILLIHIMTYVQYDKSFTIATLFFFCMANESVNIYIQNFCNPC